jgi:hypothetical protein
MLLEQCDRVEFRGWDEGVVEQFDAAETVDPDPSCVGS